MSRDAAAAAACVVINGTQGHWCRSITPASQALHCSKPADAVKRGFCLNPTRLATVGEFRRVLAKKHILLIGDSRTRYQYMDLVDALVNGNFMRCGDDITAVAETRRCKMINERLTSGGWEKFYVDTNSALEVKGTARQPASGELCDCYRSSTFTTASTFENRFFTQHTNFGTIKITYLQNFVDVIQIHAPFLYANHSGPPRCLPGRCNAEPDARFSTREALETLPSMPKVTHVFASAGWTQKDLSCALSSAMKRFDGLRFFYISHPTMPPLGMQQCGGVGASVRVLDRFTPTQHRPKDEHLSLIHI